jgi:hypothetical protein
MDRSFIHASTHSRARARARAYPNTFIHACMHTWMDRHIRTHTHTRTHTQSATHVREGTVAAEDLRAAQVSAKVTAAEEHSQEKLDYIGFQEYVTQEPWPNGLPHVDESIAAWYLGVRAPLPCACACLPRLPRDIPLAWRSHCRRTIGICARPSLRSAPPMLHSRYICMLVHGRMHTCKHMRTYTQAHTPICVQLQAELDALCARACACASRARTHLLQIGSKTSCKPRSAADATPSARTLRHAHKHARTHSSTVCVCMSSARTHTFTQPHAGRGGAGR